jgi:ankyrin repeat protein
VDVVRLLLEKGANVDATCKFGNTAIHKAIAHEHRDIVQLLLEMRADIGIDISLRATAGHAVAGAGTTEFCSYSGFQPDSSVSSSLYM